LRSDFTSAVGVRAIAAAASLPVARLAVGDVPLPTHGLEAAVVVDSAFTVLTLSGRARVWYRRRRRRRGVGPPLPHVHPQRGRQCAHPCDLPVAGVRQPPRLDVMSGRQEA